MIDDRYIWAVQVTSPRSGGPVTDGLLSHQHVRGRPGDAAASCQSVLYDSLHHPRRDPGTGSAAPALRAPSPGLFRTVLPYGIRARRAPRAPSVVTLFHWSPSMDRPSSHPTLQTIAVVGLGTMGTGIAEVLARALPRGHRHRHQRERRPPGLGRPRGGHGALRQQGAPHRAGAGGRARPLPHLLRPGRRRRRGSRHRGRAGVVRAQAAGVPRARRDRAARHDPGHRHQRPVGDPHGRRVPAPRARAGPALLQPGSGDEARRDRLLRPDRPARPSRRSPSWPASSARSPSRSATAPVSSPTACCSAT